LTGEIKVLDKFHAVAAGPVVNPMGYIGQIEGGSVFALGFALTEDVPMLEGQYVNQNLDTYLIPTISDIHRNLEIEAIDDLPEGDPYGPRGIGEVASVSLAPAITSAIYQATGKRINQLPVSREQILESFSELLNI
jgi:CO/xanthine dehydrogenase Mo-binding subunit